LPLYWEESQQGQQSFLFKPQDQEVAVCQLAVQEGVVGSWQALCQAAIVNQSVKDYREERTGCCC